jgi:hypothetical protein
VKEGGRGGREGGREGGKVEASWIVALTINEKEYKITEPLPSMKGGREGRAGGRAGGREGRWRGREKLQGGRKRDVIEGASYPSRFHCLSLRICIDSALPPSGRQASHLSNGG